MMDTPIPPAGLQVDSIAGTLERLVREHAGELVRTFYREMLVDPAASTFLSTEIVETRLAHSLTKWLADLFRAHQAEAQHEEFAQYQRTIGEVHARIKISMSLVMAGMAVLKRDLSALTLACDLPDDQKAPAIIELNRRMDWAIGLMSEAYMQGSIRRAQVDEAFRLFAVGQDITLERESQYAALLDWLQGVLFTLVDRASPAPLAPITASPFGLWFRHRAGLIFQGMPSLESIDANLHQIDAVILPRLQEARNNGTGATSDDLNRLKGLVEESKFLLGDLFQNVAGIEHGRDPLTRALSRRFLPTIMGREASIAAQTGAPLTVLLLDIDHFKRVNDSWGHGAGDFVLQQVAELIMDNVRLNDFVFRFGGEEFLIALTEADLNTGIDIAERIRSQLAGKALRLPRDATLQVTASIGIATFAGHPDFNWMIEAADRALYRAKQAGRNRLMVATPDEMAGT